MGIRFVFFLKNLIDFSLTLINCKPAYRFAFGRCRPSKVGPQSFLHFFK